jgi:hypothetical protein
MEIEAYRKTPLFRPTQLLKIFGYKLCIIYLRKNFSTFFLPALNLKSKTFTVALVLLDKKA